MAYPAGRTGATDVPLKAVPYVSTLRRPWPGARHATDAGTGRDVAVVRMERAGRALWPAMRDLLNYEIVVRGNSYPLRTPLTEVQFEAYYCSNDVFALTLELPAGTDDDAGLPHNKAGEFDFGRRLVGCVHIKPNYPQRCEHVCNGAFLVVPQFQRSGAGVVLGRRFQALAQELGYQLSMFNLVFTANAGSVALWRRLGFTPLAVVPGAGMLKAKPGDATDKAEAMSDAVIFIFPVGRVIGPAAPQPKGAVAQWADSLQQWHLRAPSAAL